MVNTSLHNIALSDASPDRQIYFLSDFHLGAPDYAGSLIREKKILRFLDHIEGRVAALFLLGDMFDFWYEYKQVVPKHFVRLLGKLATMADKGIPIHFFVGNHDMWMKDYFEKELGIKVYFHEAGFTANGRRFYIAHGDGLGPGDKGYKFLKKIFRSKFCNWLFGKLHPDWGIGLAGYFSRKSRAKTGSADAVWMGESEEWLVVHSKEILRREFFDYFIYGHRHYPIQLDLTKNSQYINLGDWITNFTYGSFDGSQMQLKKWEDE
ncbi:UDP-2,3-diacylglucosamine diphosphatase [Arachidicoccus terrestris]|uniref:UDP-2,3-diacylglucosamine diphosphatase n=1 Tax=Arachidicoccus terrestris TaxID=2875539 RepID=UPI001CC723A4|nr:UDP-2,3-diacylglucosamine diphosphatase [Arachidicoccus terrestris]UAY54057.1 UDP-2,3-diacylglucosamine diphosphatase [Arachidicoccus terrestris]